MSKPDYIICGTSRGGDVAASVNALIDSVPFTVANLKALPTGSEAVGTYVVRARVNNSKGGVYAWEADKSKAANDGVEVIAPEAIAAWDGTEANVSQLTGWTGGGTGAWVAVALSRELLQIDEKVSDAVDEAAIDATAKANTAKSEAIAAAEIDATAKDSVVMSAVSDVTSLGNNPLAAFEPNSNLELFDSLSGASKWWGGVLAPNGKIYGIPSNSTQVLEIDPVTQTTTLFGSLSGTGKWIGGVLAPNGKIYGIPLDSTQVLEIDPVTQTTAVFGRLSGT